MELSKYLKRARVKRGLTQADVSGRLGLKSPQSISNIERGLTPVPMRHLGRLMSMYRLPKREALSRWRRDVLLRREG
jgi:transcriptional regulator with XRE-family HTH domain